VTKPIEVTTTFTNNAITRIYVDPNHDETVPIIESAKAIMIPQIIETQSLAVDNVSGATMSSGGIKNAVHAAITAAGGDAEEWYTDIRKNDGSKRLDGYDVIVVGLGGAGMAAYVKAAEPINGYNPAVFGIEVGGKVGGNSATAGGPMSINSEKIKEKYGIGDYANKEALLKEWYSDMEADVPDTEIPSLTSFQAPYGTGGFPPQSIVGTTYNIPDVTKKTPAYSGGPKWQIIKKLIDESGKTVDWLIEDYDFHFTSPGGLAYAQYQIVTNYGAEAWNAVTGSVAVNGTVNGGYGSDDGNDLYKTTMFTRAIEKAKNRNAKSGYQLELRAESLIKDGSGKIIGVKAKYRGNTTWEIYGKTVILATGGFIANPQMKEEYYGSNVRTEAVDTERGDGITMAIRDANAGTYNIDMPGTVHIAQVQNIIRERINEDPAKDTFWKVALTNLLLKGDSLVVALKKGQAGDLRGKRFCNESGFFIGSIAFDNWKAGGYFAAIYSDDILAGYKTNGMSSSAMVMFLGQGSYTPNTPIPDLDKILEIGAQKGNVERAATLDELALKLGVPADVLKQTVTDYAGYVSNQKDDEHEKPFYALAPQVTIDAATAGGYTAIIGAGYFYGNGGGLDVDIDMQVLDTNKNKIPGLYAVGQDSMGVLFNNKKAYVGYGAAAQGWAITSGRLAGANAAAAAIQ
jgi:hypothetical protein